jgi:hypothetical protein
MADRYWVGGTGTWNTTTTTNWSAISGGSGGASVPTSADTVTFNTLSNATGYTVTMVNGAVCSSVTVAGPAAGNVTISDLGSWSVYGSFTLAATGVTWTYTGNITFASISTGNIITTNGVSIPGGFHLNGVGGEWTLGSALTLSNSNYASISTGTFNTGNFNITGGLKSFGTLTRSVILGSSTVNITTANSWGFTDVIGLTFNAGTSTISWGGISNVQFDGGGLIYNNVSFSATNQVVMNGENTFNNLSIIRPVFISIMRVLLTASQTVTGTFTANGGTYNQRLFFLSNTIGITRTLTCASLSSPYADYQDVTVSGGAAPLSEISLGDAGGNSGITFTAPKTVYWNLAGNQNWSATGWAASSGGTPSISNFPLAQDIAVFNNAGSVTGAIRVDLAWNIGTFNASARTGAMTLTLAADLLISGNWLSGAGLTITGAATAWKFFGRNTTQTITSAGVTTPGTLQIFAIGGTVAINGALIVGAVSHAYGTLDLTNGGAGNYTLTCALLNTNNVNIRQIAFGTGSIILTGASAAWTATTSTNLTITGTGVISLTSASAKTFAGGGFANYPTLNQGGAGALTITGSNTFNDITNAYGAVSATSILFTAGTTSTFANWNASGTAGKLLTIRSVTAATHTLSKASGIVSASYLSLTNSIATGGATWYAGVDSTNVSGNAGWLFTAVAIATAAFFLLFS